MTFTETATAARRPSELVIEAIANRADVDPLDLEVPLGEVIDPDALDSLFTSPFEGERHGGRVEFTYEEYRVTVVSDPEAGVSVDVAPVDERGSADSGLGRQQV